MIFTASQKSSGFAMPEKSVHQNGAAIIWCASLWGE